MYVSSCPKCNRMPKIIDIKRIKGKRVRICHCPNMCSVIPKNYNWKTYSFTFYGEGDDNKILKQWNSAISMYVEESKKEWQDRHYSSSWITDENVVLY